MAHFPKTTPPTTKQGKSYRSKSWKSFPFASAITSHVEPVWPVAMLMVAYEMQTGCALVPQVDPMYGPKNSSANKQAELVIDRLPENSIVMADSGFGVFSLAFHCQTRGKEFLLRLTKQRYKSHLRNATLVEEGPGDRTHHLIWKPSSKERKNHPHLSFSGVWLDFQTVLLRKE